MATTNIKDIDIICDPSNKNSDGSYKINIQSLGVSNFIASSVKSISFRNLMYNVRSKGLRINNIFYFNLNGGLEQVVLPEGFYSIYELLALVQSGIEAILLGSGIIPLPTLDVLDYNSISGKVFLTINGNGAGTPFELLGGTYPLSINNILGNTVDTTLDTLGATQYTFNSIINLQSEDRVHLVSTAIAQNCGACNTSAYKTSRNISLLRAIPVNAGFGGLVVYESNDIDAEALRYSLTQNYSSMDIRLTDVYGETIDLQNSSMFVNILTWTKV